MPLSSTSVWRNGPTNMNLTLYVWRQKDILSPGRMVRYEAANMSPDMSFLEMLDVVNERLMENGEDPVAFDNDCREGICGACGMMINGVAHGPQRETATCELHLRRFKDVMERDPDVVTALKSRQVPRIFGECYRRSPARRGAYRQSITRECGLTGSEYRCVYHPQHSKTKSECSNRWSSLQS